MTGEIVADWDWAEGSATSEAAAKTAKAGTFMIEMVVRDSGPNVAQRTSNIKGGRTMSVPILVGLLLLIVVAIIGTSITRRNATSTAGTQTTVIVIVAVVIVAIVVYFILG